MAAGITYAHLLVIQYLTFQWRAPKIKHYPGGARVATCQHSTHFPTYNVINVQHGAKNKKTRALSGGSCNHTLHKGQRTALQTCLGKPEQLTTFDPTKKTWFVNIQNDRTSCSHVCKKHSNRRLSAVAAAIKNFRKGDAQLCKRTWGRQDSYIQP